MPRRSLTSPTQWRATVEFMHKGLDTTFVHYGIRPDDLTLIQKLAVDAGLAPEWVTDLLRALHEKKIRADAPLDERDVQRLVNEYLDKIGKP